ncbi:unnamed protein product [Diamesa tonsa]
MLAAYSFYTWPSARVLAEFLFFMRKCLPDKKILEIGSGTSLPGILCAKLGANVILSDSACLPKSLEHIKRCCALNNLKDGEDIRILGLTWGLLGSSCFDVGKDLDMIIGSDCFYDPSVFEDILVTISLLLELNPKASFFFTYQERSSDWSLESLLRKWNLNCINVNLDRIGRDCGIDFKDYMGGHTIYLLEITRK